MLNNFINILKDEFKMYYRYTLLYISTIYMETLNVLNIPQCKINYVEIV